MVVSQAIKGGFRLRTIDEIAERQHTIVERSPAPLTDTESASLEKKVSQEYVVEVA